jgi:hypothetical protein
LELSSSPSLADQVTAQMLSKFIEAMPEPESNSEWAARLAHSSREFWTLVNLSILLRRRSQKWRRCVVVSRQRGRSAARDLAQTSQSQGAHTVPETDMSERLRALREAIKDPSSEDLHEKLNDRVQKARDLHREALERDRTKDRGARAMTIKRLVVSHGMGIVRLSVKSVTG